MKRSLILILLALFLLIMVGCRLDHAAASDGTGVQLEGTNIAEQEEIRGLPVDQSFWDSAAVEI